MQMARNEIQRELRTFQVQADSSKMGGGKLGGRGVSRVRVEE